jgi:hypothetical protein
MPISLALGQILKAPVYCFLSSNFVTQNFYIFAQASFINSSL